MRVLIESTIRELDLDDKIGEKSITFLKKMLSPEYLKIPLHDGTLITLQEAALHIRMRDESAYICQQALVAWIDRIPVEYQGIREELDRTIRLMYPNKVKVVNLVRQLKEDMDELEKRNKKLELENENLKNALYDLSKGNKRVEKEEEDGFSIEEPEKKKRKYIS